MYFSKCTDTPDASYQTWRAVQIVNMTADYKGVVGYGPTWFALSQKIFYRRIIAITIFILGTLRIISGRFCLRIGIRRRTLEGVCLVLWLLEDFTLGCFVGD